MSASVMLTVAERSALCLAEVTKTQTVSRSVTVSTAVPTWITSADMLVPVTMSACATKHKLSVLWSVPVMTTASAQSLSSDDTGWLTDTLLFRRITILNHL